MQCGGPSSHSSIVLTQSHLNIITNLVQISLMSHSVTCPSPRLIHTVWMISLFPHSHYAITNIPRWSLSISTILPSRFSHCYYYSLPLTLFSYQPTSLPYLHLASPSWKLINGVYDLIPSCVPVSLVQSLIIPIHCYLLPTLSYCTPGEPIPPSFLSWKLITGNSSWDYHAGTSVSFQEEENKGRKNLLFFFYSE